MSNVVIACIFAKGRILRILRSRVFQITAISILIIGFILYHFCTVWEKASDKVNKEADELSTEAQKRISAILSADEDTLKHLDKPITGVEALALCKETTAVDCYKLIYTDKEEIIKLALESKAYEDKVEQCREAELQKYSRDYVRSHFNVFDEIYEICDNEHLSKDYFPNNGKKYTDRLRGLSFYMGQRLLDVFQTGSRDAISDAYDIANRNNLNTLIDATNDEREAVQELKKAYILEAIMAELGYTKLASVNDLKLALTKNIFLTGALNEKTNSEQLRQLYAHDLIDAISLKPHAYKYYEPILPAHIDSSEFDITALNSRVVWAYTDILHSIFVSRWIDDLVSVDNASMNTQWEEYLKANPVVKPVSDKNTPQEKVVNDLAYFIDRQTIPEYFGEHFEKITHKPVYYQNKKLVIDKSNSFMVEPLLSHKYGYYGLLEEINRLENFSNGVSALQYLLIDPNTFKQRLSPLTQDNMETGWGDCFLCKLPFTKESINPHI